MPKSWQALAPVALFLTVPGYAQTLQQAESLWRSHDYINASSAFDALLKAHPENATYKVRAGQFYLARYYTEDAAKLFQEAIALDPKNAQAYLGLARVYEEGFSGKATEAATKAIELDPKLYEAE